MSLPKTPYIRIVFLPRGFRESPHIGPIMPSDVTTDHLEQLSNDFPPILNIMQGFVKTVITGAATK